MSIDLDDEILQDFLVEAGEILELLGEQLVELENSPEDNELLNAIFRGFHTIKGGAGFLALDAMVGVCHKAEDVFNVLRQGERKVNTELMDVILQVVDHLNDMFEIVRTGNFPKPVEQELLDQLQTYTVPESAAPEVVEVAVEVTAEEVIETDGSAPVTENAADAVEQEFELMLGIAEGEASEPESDEITESEFDNLLDALHGKGGSPTPAEEKNAAASDEITETEFDDLLDALHGKGSFNAEKVVGSVAEITVPTVASGDITEEEFDNLLDDLHGKGKFKAKLIDDKSEEIIVKPVEKSAQITKSSIEPGKIKTPAPAPIAKPKSEVKKAEPTKNAPHAETTVRVDTQTLDNIMNMVGELVLVRNRFQTLAVEKGDEDIVKAVGNLDVVTADLQLAVMKTRMQPIKKVFGRFPRVVRDLARSLKK